MNTPSIQYLGTQRPSVSGAVVIGTEIYIARVPSEFLVVNGAQMISEAHRFHVMVARATHDDGDDELSASMQKVVDQLTRLLKDRRVTRQPDVSPELITRARFPVWEVESQESALRYARSLVEFGACATGSELEFVVQISDTPTLSVLHSLSEVGSYAQPFRFQCVNRSELTAIYKAAQCNL